VSEYKVIAGRYQIDGSEVVITNPQGRGTLQGILDHYAGIGFEVLDTQLDTVKHEIIVMLRKGAPMAASPMAAAPMAAAAAPVAAAAAAPADDDDLPPRRRGGGGGGGKRRRSKAELDRLYRE